MNNRIVGSSWTTSMCFAKADHISSISEIRRSGKVISDGYYNIGGVLYYAAHIKGFLSDTFNNSSNYIYNTSPVYMRRIEVNDLGK